MREDLDAKLVAKYPKLFVNRYADMRETAMCWGFEVGDGWYNIIDSLCRVVQSEIDNSEEQYKRTVKENTVIDSVLRGETELFEKEYGPLSQRFYAGIYEDFKNGTREKREPIEPIPQVTVEQVKEKYGTLRFYVSQYTHTIGALIHMAESMSAKTCETCGAPGKMTGRGWLSVRCREHTAPENLADYDKE